MTTTRASRQQPSRLPQARGNQIWQDVNSEISEEDDEVVEEGSNQDIAAALQQPIAQPQQPVEPPTQEQMTEYIAIGLKQQFQQKQEKHSWMKYFEYSGVVEGTSNTSIHVKCLHKDEYGKQCSSKPQRYKIKQGVTTNLRNHLQNIHGIKLDEDMESGNQKKRKSSSAPTVPFNAYDDAFVEVTRGIAYHIIKEKLSLNHISSPGYGFLLRKACPRFRVPSRFWLSSQLIPAMVKITKQRSAAMMISLGHRVAVTTDGWKNRQNLNFVSLTGRFVKISSTGLSLKEKLLDFKMYGGSQTGPVVRRQLRQQMAKAGIKALSNLRCFVTSDRGSNILSAVTSDPELASVSCFAHVMHRTVLSCMEKISTKGAINKVIRMAAGFSSSVPRSSAFTAWQRRQKYHPLLTISPCKTRWYGFLESMVRHLIIQDRLIHFITETPDSQNINLAPLRAYVLQPHEQKQLAAVVYILSHVCVFDQESQDKYEASGVKYMKRLATLRDRIKLIQNWNSDEQITNSRASREDIQRLDMKFKLRLPLLEQRDVDIVSEMCGLFLKELAIRTKLDQLFEMRVISFFDPYWQLDLPEWAVPSRMNLMSRQRITGPVKREIVYMWRAMREYLKDNPMALEAGRVQVPVDNTVISDGVAEETGCILGSGLGSLPETNETVQRPYDPQHSSQESDDVKKRKILQNLNQELYGAQVMPNQDLVDEQFNDMDGQVLQEINTYLYQRDNYRNNVAYLQPLVFWFEFRHTFPCLFQLALKALATPATSVFSEQIFSKAGHISTKQRAKLDHQTIENLVYLQRSMNEKDVQFLSATALRAERKLVEQRRMVKVRKDIYQKAMQLHNDAVQAQMEADQQAEQAGVGDDENWVFSGNAAFQQRDIEGEEQEYEMDDALEDVDDLSDLSDMENDSWRGMVETGND